MSSSFSAVILATAGWAEQGDYGFYVVMLFLAVFSPLVLIGDGGWFTLTGLCLLAIDIFVAIKVGKSIYRVLCHRWHVPEGFTFFLLAPVTACTVALLNVIASWAVVLVCADVLKM